MEQLPSDLFLNQSGEAQIINESATAFEVEKIEYGGEFKTYVKGAIYSKKGLYIPEALYACNIVKRLIVNFPLVLLNLRKFNDVGMKVVGSFILNDKYRLEFIKEFQKLISNFIGTVNGHKFAQIFSTLIEYDFAYKIRIMDILSETTQKQLSIMPYRECKRLLRILISRENDIVAKNIKKFSWLLILLWTPKYRKAFRKALQLVDFSKLQYDESDRYWASQMSGYNSFGMNREDRIKMYKQYPIAVNVKNIK